MLLPFFSDSKPGKKTLFLKNAFGKWIGDLKL
jgi:hypothetical protein